MRLPGPDTACWLDGRRVPLGEIRIPLQDLTVQAGLGLFETVEVLHARPRELDEHMDRLRDGAVRLGIEPGDPDRLRTTVIEAAGTLEAGRGWLKVILTGSGNTVVFAEMLEDEAAGQAATAILLPWRRNPRDPLSGLKTLSYGPNVLGLRLARSRGADEGIWLNTKGHLAEGCSSNLFLFKSRKLYTAGEGEGILAGVVRSLVLRTARGLGLTIHVGKVRLKRLLRADEAFFSSSVRGIRPLIAFEGRPVGSGEPGPLTRKIAAEVERVRAGELSGNPGD